MEAVVNRSLAMRPHAAFLILALGACAQQADQPRPSIPANTTAAPMPAPQTMQPQRSIEPGYNPYDTGAMGQYPTMPQQVSPAFRGL
jgi:hypothetical protein